MRHRVVSAAVAVACIVPSVVSTTPALAAPTDPQIVDSSSTCTFATGANCTTTLTFDSAVTAWGNAAFTWDNVNLGKATLASTTPKTNTKVLTFTWRVSTGITPIPSSLNIASWLSTGYISKAGTSTKIPLALLNIANATDIPTAPPVAPAAPVLGSVTASTATISWDAPADPSITGYEVYRDGVMLLSTTNTTANIAGLAPATTYSYTVKAINSVGKSVASTATSMTTLATAPSTPTGLGLSGVTSNSAVISWSAPASNGAPITAYQVFKDGALSATTENTTVTIPGLTPSTNYSFTVKAVNSVGTSGPSIALTVATPAVGAVSTIPRIETANTTCTFVVSKYCTTTFTFDMPITVWGTPTFTLDNANLSAANMSTSSKRTNTTSLSYTYRVNKTIPTPSTLNIKSWSATGYITKNPNGAAMNLPLISVFNYIALPAIPVAPTALAVSNTTATTTTLSWTPPSNIKTAPTSYEIYQDGALVATTPAGATSHILTGLTPATTSTITVKAVNAGGTSEASVPVTVVNPSAPPAQPSAPSLGETSPTSISLSWPAPLANGSDIIGYVIYRNGIEIGNSPTPTYVSNGLEPGTSYEFTVKAVNAVGVSAESPALTAATESTAPDAPAAPSVGNTTSSSIALSWPAPPARGSAITEYVIYRDGLEIGASTSASYVAIGLAPGVSYEFTVKAINGVGASELSAPISGTTDASTPATPSAPTSGTTTTTTATFSWPEPERNGADITGYVIYRDGIEIGTSTTASYTATGLASDTTYTFSVKAINSVGASQTGNSVSISTDAAPVEFAAYTWTQGATRQTQVPYTYHTEWQQTGSHQETYQSGTETYVTGTHQEYAGQQQFLVGEQMVCNGMFCSMQPIYAYYSVFRTVTDYGTRPVYSTRTVADYGNVTVRDSMPTNSYCVSGAPTQCTYSDSGSNWVRTEPTPDTPPVSDTRYQWVDNGTGYQRVGYIAAL